YDLILLPMGYLVPDEMPEHLSAFVKNGGTMVATYQTGYVNETDLCFQGGAPGPLSQILGIRVEEFDALPDSVRRPVIPRPAEGHGLSGVYEARHFLDIVHCEGAEPLAEYGSDFYAGSPAVTVNTLGSGRAYYIASRNDDRFQDDFFGHLAESIALPRTLPGLLPPGVTAHLRENGSERFLFILNFTRRVTEVSLPPGAWRDVDTGETAKPGVRLGPLGSKVFQCKS
ncbi:MAG: beta-galactosidase trimerization domain-containing protein, partial [Verrucomicrobiota bacterium]